jgi:hypothetical protein
VNLYGHERSSINNDKLLKIYMEEKKKAWAWFHDVWTCGAKVLEY